MDVGIGLPASGPRAVATARFAEDIGLDLVSISDVLLGDGSPSSEAVTLAAAVAATTERVTVEFGVLVLPLRPLALLAPAILTLQHLSGGRIALGGGAGGFPDSPLWQAAGASGHDRGRRLETMLERLPRLLAGEPTRVDDAPSSPEITLAPPADPPPMLVGGHGEHAVERAARLGDGWFPSLMSPAVLGERIERLRARARELGRPVPRVHFGTHAALGPDADTQRADLARTLVERLSIPADEAPRLVLTGGPDALAERFAAYADAGADSMTLTLDGQDVEDQIRVVAAARALLRG